MLYYRVCGHHHGGGHALCPSSIEYRFVVEKLSAICGDVSGNEGDGVSKASSMPVERGAASTDYQVQVMKITRERLSAVREGVRVTSRAMWTIKNHYTRGQLKRGSIQVICIASKEQPGDMFTKNLNVVLLRVFRKPILGTQ